MLSGETTIGKFPVECVQAFDRIARRIERAGGVAFTVKRQLGNDQAKLLQAAVAMANSLQADGILVFTRKGFTARGVAAMRPESTPIFDFSNNRTTLRQMRMLRGVQPFFLNFGAEPELTVQKAIYSLAQDGHVQVGNKVVVVSDILASDRFINSIQLRNVD
jgi:pyruvate kinase